MMYNPQYRGPRPHGFPPQPPRQSYLPSLPSPDPFWQRPNLQAHLVSLLENVSILKSIGDELEAIEAFEKSQSGLGHDSRLSNVLENEHRNAEQTADDSVSLGQDSAQGSPENEILLKTIQGSAHYWPESISFATQAAQQLLGAVKAQLDPLQGVLDGSAGQEKVQAAKRLAQKRLKLSRNRKWRSRKRQRVAESLRKEREQYDKADREADEWRAKEIAKVIAKRKMEKMRALAEKTSKEEKGRRQEETEMVLIIEKLQELRSLRITKLKKQGRFFPEEDDQFVERVRAAVEEEERQAAAARSTSAAAVAILHAEEARKAAAGISRESNRAEHQEQGELGVPTDPNNPEGLDKQNLSQQTSAELNRSSGRTHAEGTEAFSKEKHRELPKGADGLPPEFYYFYFGGSFDMGALIEIRQAWDSFIMPGGSRIPQHWVQPPPPADPVWGSYLVKKHPQKKRRKRMR